MTQQELSKAKKPDLRASLAAMSRAVEMARNTAIQTNTEIVLVKDGRPVRVTAVGLRRSRERVQPKGNLSYPSRFPAPVAAHRPKANALEWIKATLH